MVDICRKPVVIGQITVVIIGHRICAVRNRSFVEEVVQESKGAIAILGSVKRTDEECAVTKDRVHGVIARVEAHGHALEKAIGDIEGRMTGSQRAAVELAIDEIHWKTNGAAVTVKVLVILGQDRPIREPKANRSGHVGLVGRDD